jgi:hypothetical protein
MEDIVKINRRNQFLLGFGGLAVILLIVFNMWYPPVSDDSATGAVGAVKKHRQQQISQQDVLLGDEATRKQEKIAYGDFLYDAVKLENRSAALAMVLRSRDAENLGVIRAELEASIEALDAQSIQIENRARLAAQSAIESLDAILVELGPAIMGLDSKAAIQAELRSFEESLQNRSAALSSRDIEATRLQLAHLADQIESRVVSLASEERMIGRLDSIRYDIENRAASLESRQAELAAISEHLGRSAHLESAALGRYGAYLAAMAEQMDSLGVARQHLQLASRNLQMQSALDSRDVEALGIAAEALASRAMALQNRAVANLESRMEIMAIENRAVVSLDASLRGVEDALNSRSAQLSAQSRQALELGIRDASQALASRRSGLEASMLASRQMELAAVEAHLEHAANLESRWSEASMLASRGAQLANRGVQLESRAFQLQNRAAQLEVFRAYLAKMTADLESRSASAVGSRDAQALASRDLQQLGTRAAQLESRAAQLEAAYKQ